MLILDTDVVRHVPGMKGMEEFLAGRRRRYTGISMTALLMRSLLAAEVAVSCCFVEKENLLDALVASAGVHRLEVEVSELAGSSD